MIGALTDAPATVFAAIAATAALLSIWQARILHKASAAERARDRAERRELFEREAAERQQMAEVERRVRQLEQIGRVSELVARVRQTARDEADPGREQRIGGVSTAPFFWNARKQLELGLNVLGAFGGPDLPACCDLAIASHLTHLPDVVSAATTAFDELAKVTVDVRAVEAPR